MARNYDVKEFSSEELKVNGKIIIPTYQRGLVWTTKKRKEFIDTIFKGNPFGVVLVYEKNDKFEVVDGLQRLSTMRAYMDNPLDFYGVNDTITNEEELDYIVEDKLKNAGKKTNGKLVLSGRKTLKKKTIEYVKKMGKPKAVDVWKFLSVDYGFNVDNFEAYNHFSTFYDGFMEDLKFPHILIPAIVYTGPYDELPDVFQRLNTGSVKLTKYEIFASIWKENLLLIHDEDILDNVMSKYNTLKESSSFEVNVSEIELKEKGITLFEYCYALSEILNDEDKEYSILFPGEKKSTDPTGFELLALIAGLPVNKSNRLIESEYLGKKTPTFLVDVKNALMDCVMFLYNSLKEWIIDIKGTAIPNDSTYQIYHMIMAVFHNSYVLDLKNERIQRKDDKALEKWRNKFSKYAYKHYLFDILSQFWSKNRQVSDLDNLIKNDSALGKYTNNVTREEFEGAIDEYCKGLYEKSSPKIENTSKLLLNYYYRLLIREDKNREKFFKKKDKVIFDVEHITPIAKFGENTLKLPISAIGNLCYLPVKDNRSKRDKTIYQYADDRPTLTFNVKFQKIIDYPSREKLEFIDYPVDSFGTAYRNFIEKREENFRAKLVNLLMNEKLEETE